MKVEKATRLPGQGRAQFAKNMLKADVVVLVFLALARLLMSLLADGQYGLHRDELALLDDARRLAWGYVAYPPLTPAIARVALDLFGPSLLGLRLFSALAISSAMLLAGLMTQALGGSRRSQLISALATAIAPVALSLSSVLIYETFDYFWWAVVAYLMIRLLQSDNPRWWLAIGAAIGLGMLSKYTMAFLVAGIAAGVIFTPARRYLRSPWLWGGAALAVLICVPNLVWQFQHNFISLDFLSTIHARDIRIGRTNSFLVDQLYLCANIATIPLWISGLRFYWFVPQGRRYRPIGWMFAVPFLLFLVARGRGYYLAPAYPMLIAAGAYLLDERFARLTSRRRTLERGLLYGALIVGGALVVAVCLPLAPVSSGWWQVASNIDELWREEIGWPELVQTIVGIRDSLPAGARGQVGVLASNYGEAGAIDLYGPAYGLPQAISGINSYWLRGYGESPPQTLIVIGFNRAGAEQIFASCRLAGHTTNRYGVRNEETGDHPDIFVCRDLRQSWPAFWQSFRYFG